MPTVEQVTSQLQSNLSNASPELCKAFALLIQRYELEIKTDHFATGHLVVVDKLGQTVSVYEGATVNGLIRSSMRPISEILILVADGITIGWVSRDQIIDFDSGFAVYAQQIRQLPKDFLYPLPCPHLGKWGGFYNEDKKAWQCFGCGELVGTISPSS